jgi:hypothetical protein
MKKVQNLLIMIDKLSFVKYINSFTENSGEAELGNSQYLLTLVL